MPRTTLKTTPSHQTELSPRRLPTQERARQTVEQVLFAAGAEIERAGLDKLTTKRIAAAAGLSVGAVYEYFPNKQSIVHALADQWLGKLSEAIDVEYIGRKFTHDINFQSVLSMRKTILRHFFENRFPFLDGATKWNHNFDVV